MSAEIESTQPEVEVIGVEVIEADPTEVIYQGQCPSLSGRSTLTYEIGRHPNDQTMHLRIVGNSGGGMWSKNWASASQIHKVVLGATSVTAKDLHVLHEGRSINTGGFVLAAIKELGLVRVGAENTRLHEHVPGVTFEKAVTATMAKLKVPKPEIDTKASRRKAKET